MPKTIKSKGEYRGQVRHRYNILEQWDGKRWREVANFMDEKDYWPPNRKIHFDVEDALHDARGTR